MSGKLKKLLFRLMSVALCVSMLLGCVCAYADDDTTESSAAEDAESQTKKDELQDQLSSIKDQQSALQEEINAAKTEKEKAEKQKKNLDYQISLLRSEIDLLDEKIELVEAEIAEKENNIKDTEDEVEKTKGLISQTEKLISEKEADIKDTFNTFAQRLRSMYMNDNVSTLGLLLGADSFSEFLTRAEVLRRIAEHDNDTIAALTEDKNEIVTIKEELDEQKLELEVQIAKLDSEKQELETNRTDIEQDKLDRVTATGTLNAKVSEIKDQIQDIAALEADYNKRKDELQQIEREIQAELNEIYKNNQSSMEYVGGTFLWPVANYTKITSYFGWRFNGTNFHTGIDISGSGIYGKPARAANGGVVIYVGWQPKGYGNYVIIDHGGGYSTLYAHGSEVCVSVGQTVAQGDTVLKIGSTGWSTGPHLHFEIRKNGVAYDPMTEFN